MTNLIKSCSLIVGFLFFTLNLYAQDNKIAYIDIWRIIEESKAGAEAKRLLESETQKKRDKLQKMREEIQKSEEDFRKKFTMLSDEERAKRQEELLQKRDEFIKLLNEAEIELQKRDASLTKEILLDIKDIVDKIAQEENYFMVYEKSQGGILYVKDADDITAKVIKEYDKLHLEKKKKGTLKKNK